MTTSPTVLIVEQEGVFHSLLTTRLHQALGVTVLTASTDEAARSLLATATPQLVLMELHLTGGTSGLDLACWMRDQLTLAHTRRVLCSGTPLEVIQDEALRHGQSMQGLWHRIVEKPVSVAAMLQHIAEELGMQQAPLPRTHAQVA